jgi:hypothetical protein
VVTSSLTATEQSGHEPYRASICYLRHYFLVITMHQIAMSDSRQDRTADRVRVDA